MHVDPRRFLRSLFDAAVDVARPAHIIPAHLPPRPRGRTVVIGAGKASAAMARAFEEAWDGPLGVVVLTRYDYGVACDNIRIAEAAHPVPDDAGVAATRDILDAVGGLGADDLVVALISGGGSALLCAPAPGLTLADKKALNTELLRSGAAIDEMNCLRRHVSAVKGGRLAAACHPAAVVSLLISDVPGDDPMNIASGPTVGDPTTLADARALVEKYAMELPDPIIAALNDPRNESIKPDDPRLATARTIMAARPQASLEAAARVAEAAGVTPILLGDAIEGDARALGRQMAADARAYQTRGDSRPAVLISGGETTVTLPRDGRDLGRGGRNVDFLLSLAEALAGAPGIHALAGDTDGVDGADEIAGAIVTPDTLARAAAQGVDFAAAMARFDGHGFFGALGDQVITGPTLTNVNDFRAILVT